MPIVKTDFKVKRKSGPCNRSQGQVGRQKVETVAQIRQTPNPFQKHQTVEVTVTLPHDPNGPMLQPVRKERAIFYNTTFMEAIAKAQAKWPKLPVSVRTLTVKFDEDSVKPESAEKV